MNSCTPPLGHSMTRRLDRIALAETKGQRQFGLREIARAGFDAARLRAIGAEDTRDRADRIAIRLGSDQAQPQPAVPGQLLVAIEVRPALVGGQQKVHRTIAVEIAVCQAARHFGRREAGAGAGGDIAKHSLAIVEEEVRRLRVSHVAVNPAYGLIDVTIHGNQIEAPVQVDIEERAAESEAGARRLADSAILRRVLVNAFARRDGTAPSFRYRSW